MNSECCQLSLRTLCRKEDINLRFVGVTEHDYEWLTAQIVEVANRWVGVGETHGLVWRRRVGKCGGDAWVSVGETRGAGRGGRMLEAEVGNRWAGVRGTKE